MNIIKAEQELNRLRNLNDGNRYCIKVEGRKCSIVVEGRSEEHLNRIPDQKITDFIEDYNIEDDLR